MYFFNKRDCFTLSFRVSVSESRNLRIIDGAKILQLRCTMCSYVQNDKGGCFHPRLLPREKASFYRVP